MEIVYILIKSTTCK